MPLQPDRLDDFAAVYQPNAQSPTWVGLKFNQEELAHQAKVDRTYVSGVERGLRNPSIKVLARLAKALKTTPAALLNGN